MRRRPRRTALGAPALLALLGGGAQAAHAPPEPPALTLVEDGVAKSVIVVPASGSGLHKGALEAAKMIARHVAEMSGATLDIVHEDGIGRTRAHRGRIEPDRRVVRDGIDAFVLVGEGELAKTLGVTSRGLGNSGIRLRTVGNALALVGAQTLTDGATTRHAAIELLEMLGFRYLWPGRLGKVAPKRSTVAIPAIDRSYTPSVGQRGIRLWKGDSYRFAKGGLHKLGLGESDWTSGRRKAAAGAGSWQTWQRLGGKLGIRGGHAFGHVWGRYGEKHPQIGALQKDGTRDQTPTARRARFCVSNPTLIELIAEEVIDKKNNDKETKGPGLRCVVVGPNDGSYTSFCMCESCRALDPPEAPKIKLAIFEKVGRPQRTHIDYPSLTDRYVYFWNEIAARVTKVHPDLLLGIDAYSAYKHPPVKRTLHPNLSVRFVSVNRSTWDGWQGKASRFLLRPNVLYNRSSRLRVFGGFLAGTFNHMAAGRGLVATDFDGAMGSWAVDGLNYYVTARMCWNPTQSYDELLDDYCRHGFGAAAAAVKRYFLLAERVTANAQRWGAQEEQDELGEAAEDKTDVSKGLGPQNAARLRALLARADEDARDARDDQVVRERVAFLRVGLNWTDLHVELHACGGKARAREPYDKARARRIMCLATLMMRDVVRNHPFAFNVGYMLSGRRFTAPLRWVGCRGGWPDMNERLVALLNKTRGAPSRTGYVSERTMTGRENSIDELLQLYDVDAVLARLQ